MRVAFIDRGTLDYTALTPLQRPLGGMHSALCHLAAALTGRGHEVAIFNQTTTPGIHAGVASHNIDRMRLDTLNGFDVIVSASCGSRLWRENGIVRPLVLWTGHDVDQPAVQPLRDGAERSLWNRIVLVSEWQANAYAAEFQIDRQRINVLRNAIAPAFETVPRRPYFFEAGRPPVLFYSSTPFRGLEVLLAAFPLIRARVPGCEARIYSGMSVYQRTSDSDPYRALYDRCRAIEGMSYVGPVGQSALAQAIAQLDVLAYPCTFPETSCIVLMEAMASGCLIVSTALGALPETAAGFAGLCERLSGSSVEAFARLYADFTVDAVRKAFDDPAAHAARLDRQRDFALATYSWRARAAEWEAMLRAVSRQAGRITKPGRNEPCPCGSGRRFKNCCGGIAPDTALR